MAAEEEDNVDIHACMQLPAVCNKLLEAHDDDDDDHISGDVCFRAGAMSVSTDHDEPKSPLACSMDHDLSTTGVHTQQRHWRWLAQHFLSSNCSRTDLRMICG